MNKLGLGTVQFGCNYGISNLNGQVPEIEIAKILAFAKENGISYLDTASLYGNSEEILGKFDLSNFRVITKTVRKDKTLNCKDNIKRFNTAFFESIEKLNCSQLYGLMFHEADDLLSEDGQELWALISDFKSKGYVNKIGVSVYNPEQILNIIAEYDVDLVQLPLNMLDQRFVNILPELKKKGVEVHSRSTFLQGLLLMDINNVNNYFDEIKNKLEMIKEPKTAYALNFVKNMEDVDRIIVGCTSLVELQEIFMMYNKNVENIDYSFFSVKDEKFINPSKWLIERK